MNEQYHIFIRKVYIFDGENIYLASKKRVNFFIDSGKTGKYKNHKNIYR